MIRLEVKMLSERILLWRKVIGTCTAC